jgi:hypothetical protein
MWICEKGGRCVDPCDDCEYHIEVEPVKHGKWIEVRQADSYGLRVMWECSCCGTKENWLANYCPYCGADMRGGNDG